MPDNKVNPLTMRGNLTKVVAELKLVLLREAHNSCKCGKVFSTGKVELHHINGCPLDWRRKNLVLLCTPCHALVTQANKKSKSIGELPLYTPHPRLDREYIKRVYNQSHPRAKFT